MEQSKLINIQLIDRPNPPVRISFNENEIEALAKSISEEGILVPLLVRPVGGRFEIIDGDCRLEAAYRLRLREVPAVVRNATDSETHVLRMLANLDRSDPDPVSEAIYIAKAIESGSITAEELAIKLRRGAQWVSDRLAIAEMPDYMQDALRNKQITLGVALALNQLPDDDLRFRWMFSAIQSGMTVRSANDAVREHLNLLERIKMGESPTPPPEAFREPPIVLYPCERCGERAPLTELRLVRIHARGCPIDENQN